MVHKYPLYTDLHLYVIEFKKYLYIRQFSNSHMVHTGVIL